MGFFFIKKKKRIFRGCFKFELFELAGKVEQCVRNACEVFGRMKVYFRQYCKRASQ
uniref:Uncharacterized protein n=1 Tax=Rhizophora mucronata TaxID=61149 RepID=A0A2P2P7V2_RHIMU